MKWDRPSHKPANDVKSRGQGIGGQNARHTSISPSHAHVVQLQQSIGNRAVMQLLKSSLSQKEKPIQRYTVMKNGTKESENGKLLLANKKDVYVTPEMFNQANGIDGSQVEFEYLPYKKTNSKAEELQAIWPKIREETELKDKESNFKDYESDSVTTFIYESELIIQNMKQALYKEEAMENIRKGLKITEEDWEEDMGEAEYCDEIDLEIQKLALANPERLKAQKDYNQRISLLISLDAELFPTDCGIMADYVSGQKGQEKKTVEGGPAAGQAYHLNPAMETLSSDKNLWGSHHAAIIMADGGDHVSFEGAKHTSKDKVAKVNFDTSWYYAMYGNKEGQSFDDAYKDYFEPGFKTTKTEKL